jgi:hypothetical protein
MKADVAVLGFTEKARSRNPSHPDFTHHPFRCFGVGREAEGRDIHHHKIGALRFAPAKSTIREPLEKDVPFPRIVRCQITVIIVRKLEPRHGRLLQGSRRTDRQKIVHLFRLRYDCCGRLNEAKPPTRDGVRFG